jgi:phospholipase D1/2
VLIVDDRLVRVGSSNLNNRSMGLDTECDLAVEAVGEPRIERTIAAFRDRLLGEHLGVAPQEVARTLCETGSLVATIERLRGGERTLRDLDGSVPSWLDRVLPDASVVDPERPVQPAQLIDQIVGVELCDRAHRPLLRTALVLLALLCCAVAWRWGPLAEWVRPQTLAEWAEPLRQSPLGPLAMVAGFVVGGLAVFPVTVLIVTAALIFGPIGGLVYSSAGSLLSAAVTYGLGRALGTGLVRPLASKRLDRVSRTLRRGEILSIAAVRAIPIAPFTIVNLVAGAIHVPFRGYLLGTILGMAPGMVGLTALGGQLGRTFEHPGVTSMALLLAVACALLLVGLWIRRAIRPRGSQVQSV